MIDAGRAFQFARGAMWHLDVALPQLEAATNGAARADELIQAAARHVAHAADDAGRVGDPAAGTVQSSIAVVQARIGVQPSELDHEAFDALRNARIGAAQLVEAIVPTLDAPQQLLPMSPAASAPAAELALVDQAVDARRFRATSEPQRNLVERILASGSIDAEPIRWVGGYGNGNGAMPVVRVRHPESPHVWVDAVRRPPTAQAAQEEFFARLATAAGVDDYFAPVRRREDGSALVMVVPGDVSWERGVSSGEDVRSVMRSWYAKRFAMLDGDQVDQAAHVDFDRVRSLDYIAAQPDRNAGGLLVDRDASTVHYIDNGFAGRGETGNVLRPGLKFRFLGEPAGRATIARDAARAVESRLDDAALAHAHSVLRAGPDGVLPSGHATALAEDASDAYLGAMRARRDQVAAGSFEYEPIDADADPLAAVDQLRGR